MTPNLTHLPLSISHLFLCYLDFLKQMGFGPWPISEMVPNCQVLFSWHFWDTDSSEEPTVAALWSSSSLSLKFPLISTKLRTQHELELPSFLAKQTLPTNSRPLTTTLGLTFTHHAKVPKQITATFQALGGRLLEEHTSFCTKPVPCPGLLVSFLPALPFGNTTQQYHLDTARYRVGMLVMFLLHLLKKANFTSRCSSLPPPPQSSHDTQPLEKTSHPNPVLCGPNTLPHCEFQGSLLV